MERQKKFQVQDEVAIVTPGIRGFQDEESFLRSLELAKNLFRVSTFSSSRDRSSREWTTVRYSSPKFQRPTGIYSFCSIRSLFGLSWWDPFAISLLPLRPVRPMGNAKDGFAKSRNL